MALQADQQYPVISIEDEMKKSYVDYAMSVIVSRSLPDVRDGLKPVHRRILFAMEESGFQVTKPHKKSARAVGDVMGKYHPHGDQAIYDALVRMAQDFSMRAPLIDGQGNFGSIDGDPPAAMRYTESRLSHLATELLEDIKDIGGRNDAKDTINYRLTYDESRKEPTVLPARFPNILVNGSTGIAVGMATNIAPHNLGEAIDACLLYLDDPEVSVDRLMEIMPGPDFPTRGVIVGKAGIRSAYMTGLGRIVVSGVSHVEEGRGGRCSIVVDELPYMVNKKSFLERLAELKNEKIIDDISDIQDESDRETRVRVVIHLRKDADPAIVLNQVKKHTDYLTTFGYNAMCIDAKGKPRVMPLRDMLGAFIDFRNEVIERRTVAELNEKRDSLHKQIGLYAATSKVDDVVRVIRQAADIDAARLALSEMEFPTAGQFAELLAEADPDIPVAEFFKLSPIQIGAILALQLRRLTGLERDVIAKEALELSGKIKELIRILVDPEVKKSVLRNELIEVKSRYPMERFTVIEPSEFDAIEDEDLVERKDVVVTITNTGYVKRTDLSAYREQKRGGKGKSGMETRDDDFVHTTMACTTKTPLLFFTSRGIAHSLKAYRLPETAPNAKGRALVNLINLRKDETTSAILAMPETPEELEGRSIVFVTDSGYVRRNLAKEFADIRKNGKIAIKLEDESGNPDGKLVAVLLADDKDDILLTTRAGRVIRFPIEDLRVFKGRDSKGVRGINLGLDNEVIDASVLRHVRFDVTERDAYLAGGTTQVKDEATEAMSDFNLTAERMQEMQADEQFLLTVTELGYGKRSSAYSYRITARGALGFNAAMINEVTGPLVACFPVTDEDGLVLITDGGQTIRTRVADIRTLGRTTRGVRLFRLPDGQKIVSVAKVGSDEVEGAETVIPEAAEA